MDKEKIKTNKKRNLIISFILAIIIMVYTAIKKGSLICGYAFQNAECPIYIWIIQLIILTLVIFIAIGLIILLFKLLKKDIKKEEKENKKESKKEEKDEDKIKLENGDEIVEKWPEDEEEIKI